MSKASTANVLIINTSSFMMLLMITSNIIIVHTGHAFCDLSLSVTLKFLAFLISSRRLITSGMSLSICMPDPVYFFQFLTN